MLSETRGVPDMRLRFLLLSRALWECRDYTEIRHSSPVPAVQCTQRTAGVALAATGRSREGWLRGLEPPTFRSTI